jgi:aryl-phospho-beta-D-glucosidase BglC (GH1 family)
MKPSRLLYASTLFASSLFAQPLADQRAQHLQHGINASIWFAQFPLDYSVERLRTFTTEDDLVLIHRLGFDHIRLSIDPDPLVAWQHGEQFGKNFVAELDRVLRFALDQKLAVIVDIHPEEHYKQSLFQGDDSVQRFGMLWRDLAQHFAGLDTNLVYFEIMNEPEQPDPFRWQGIQSFVISQIRAVAPNNTIIASGAHWSGLDDLMHLQPLAATNIIYTFHDYDPFPFTHQGATWTTAVVEPLRNVPYPSTPENIKPNLDQEPTLSGQLFVEQYGLDRWDAARVDANIAFAERWSQLHHLPVYCGEFGVHKPYADPAMRATWIRDMRTALEKHHIGWAMWDYQTNFGAVTKENGKAVPDDAVIKALGLHPTQ